MKKIKFCILIFLLISIFSYCYAAGSAVKYSNRDKVSFRGVAEPGVTVKIFVNNEEVSTIQADAEGKWTAKDVPMDPARGENIVYAKAFNEAGEVSPLSRTITVVIDKVPPNLAVKAKPHQVKGGEKVNISVKVSEKAQSVSISPPDNNSIDLYYNSQEDVWQGFWSVPIRFNSGVYEVVAIAKDLAGNVNKEKSNSFQVEAQGGGLTIVSPKPWEIFYDDKITVQGVAAGLPYIEINGQQVLVNPDNTFASEVELPKPGHNLIKINGRNAAGELHKLEQTVVKLITFPDIQTDIARAEIEYLATLGYVKAYSEDGLFKPERSLSRAEMAALIMQAKNFPVGSYQESSFRDIMENHWAMNYIETGYKFGLLQGYPDKNFKPNEFLKRTEAVTVLVRFADISLLSPDQPLALDVPFDHWAAKHIFTFQQKGLMPAAWKGQSRFYPEVPISRGEFAAGLARTPQMISAITRLIHKNPDFAVIPDSEKLPAESDQAEWAQRQASIDESAHQAETPRVYARNAHYLKVHVEPLEVRPATSLFIAAVGWTKLSSVLATAPNDEVIVLTYNSKTDRFEGYWKVPNVDHMYGNYVIRINAKDAQGRSYRAESNKFAIVAVPNMMVPEEVELQENKNIIEIPGEAGIVFSEYLSSEVKTAPSLPAADINNKASNIDKPSTLAEAPAKSGVVTKAEFAEFLVEISKAKLPKKVTYVAGDVKTTHPQAQAISACLVRGFMQLDDRKLFKPEEPVSRAFAAVGICRALKLTLAAVTKPPYQDIPKSHWAAAHIKALAQKGLMGPIQGLEFAPRTHLTHDMLNNIKKRIQ